MKPRTKKILKRSIIVLSATFLLMVLFLITLVVGIKRGYWGHVPDREELAHIASREASVILAEDNTILEKVYLENRTIVPLKEVPSHLVDALIATEDSRFFEHEGVDFIALTRVIFRSIILRQSHAGGGSTISQQLAKNLYGRKGAGAFAMLLNKLSEMVTASRLEEIYTKKEIIALYLNTVSFGENIYGIENAALRYYSKHCRELSLNEGCVLVGILKGNTLYNPRLHPDNARARKDLILSLMSEQGYISGKEKDRQQKKDLELNYKSASEYLFEYGYFTDKVKKEAAILIGKYNEEHGTQYDMMTDGLSIKTTLDSDLQQFALQAMRSHVTKLQKQFERQLWVDKFWKRHPEIVRKELKRLALANPSEKKPIILPYLFTDSVFMISAADSIRYMQSQLQAALLGIVPQTGAVKAWIGGKDFQYFPYNRVHAARQVGSVFKPLVYYTALAQGVDPCDHLENKQTTYREFEDWTPSNGDTNYVGYYSMAGALSRSLNTISVQLILKAGVDSTIATARLAGITAELPPVPSLALGVASIPLYEMMQSYACLAAKGLKQEPYCIQRITAKDGTVLYRHKQEKGSQVLEKEYCEQLTLMMQEVIKTGTARRLIDTYGCRFDAAGKTGTTQNNTDGWFIGFTPALALGVWVGCDNPALRFASTEIGQGANTALPIWAKTMQKVQSSKLRRLYIVPFAIDSFARMDCAPYLESKGSFLTRLFGGGQSGQRDSAKREKQQKRAEKKQERKEKGGFFRWFRKKKEE